MTSLKRRDVGWIGVTVAITLLSYIFPLTRAGWIWDDDMYVVNNPTLRSLDGLRAIWLEPRSLPQYYPLVHTTFWIEYHLFGPAPLGYHLVNLALHTANAILLWAILRRLAVPGAWIASALFAVHPVHVETVAWVTETKNTLSTFFYALALLCFLRFFGLDAERDDRSPAIERPWTMYALGFVFFVAALLSKTVTASLPAALALLLWWKRDWLRARDLVPLVPLAVAGLFAGLSTAWLERFHVGAQGQAWNLTAVERCLVAGRALWFYAGKLIWPFRLTFIYPRWSIDANSPVQYLPLIAAAMTVLMLWFLRERIGKGPLVGTLYFAGTMVPALGFFNVFPMRYSFVADHFQYLASAGFIALLAAASAMLAARVRMPATLNISSAVVIGGLAVLTSQQARAYRDLEALWTDTLSKNPSSWMAHTNLGLSLVHSGRIEDGIAHYRESIRLEPTLIEPRLDLGVALQQVGRADEAIQVLEELARTQPGNPVAHYNLGNALTKVGRYPEAIAELEEAVRLNPKFVEAEYNLGGVLLAAGRLDEAASQFESVLRMRPDHAASHLSLARILDLQGRGNEARAHRLAAAR